MSRKVAIVLVILAAVGVPTSLAAQDDPFLGIWELNLAESSITRGAPPRIETIVNIAEPGGFRSMLAMVGEKSTSVEIHHYNFDGSFHQTEGSDPRELSFKASIRTRSSRIRAGAERSPFIGTLSSPETARHLR